MSEEGGGDTRWKPWALAAGPLLAALLGIVNPGDLAPAPLKTLCVTAWVAAWWILEALPIAVTSLFPLVLLPLFGVRPAAEVARLYMEDMIFLLLGGFLLALALERWELHRRLALFVLRLLGGEPRRLVLGFALSAALMSMWISNSATTLVLLPIALAVGRRLDGVLAAAGRGRLEQAVLLAVAYGATAGGLGTYVGTPPNLIFRERYAKDFQAGAEGGPPEITFLQWMAAFTPLALLLAVIFGLVLARGLPRIGAAVARDAVHRATDGHRAWSRGELMVATLFALAAALWITREPIEIGATTLFGWSRWLPAKNLVTDGTVAIGLALVCFILRAPRPEPGAAGIPITPATPSAPLLEWREVEAKLPWGVLLLFGGGFALGDSFDKSGLSKAMGEGLAQLLHGMPAFVVVLGVCAFVILVTEFMNNTACTQVMLPILGAVARELGVAPAALLVPATLAASCGFAMPAGTAPNAIVFATGRVPLQKMVRVGFLLDLVCVVVVTLWMVFVALPLLGIDLKGGG